jgi:hypothetical protein
VIVVSPPIRPCAYFAPLVCQPGAPHALTACAPCQLFCLLEHWIRADELGRENERNHANG